MQTLEAALAPWIAEGGTLLDLGCGDLRLGDGLRRARRLRRYVGADIWPARTAPPAGCEYVPIDSTGRFPWSDRTFDTVLLVDVLHHCDDPGWTLAEGLRVASRAVIKDHFEYGSGTRTLLRLLDYLGNRPYGVSVPRRYFTPESFKTLCGRVRPAVQARVEVGVRLYDHIPLVGRFLPARVHFIASLDPAP